MFNVLQMTKTADVGNLTEFKFDFEFDDSSMLPTNFVVMGQRKYLIAEGSTAKNVSTNTYYRYNGAGKEWVRSLVQPSTPVSTATQITENGDYSVINDDVAGYNEVSVDVNSALTEKDIAENGTYYASDDNVEGYSVVNVNVKASSVKTDVIFYDYDGTVVTSYAADEFVSLSALPDNPVHEGLTAQGWNWSLADAKDYVSNYGKLNVGQMYITDDGRTRIYIRLPEGRTSPVLRLWLSTGSELDIDWGDNSPHSTFVPTSAMERHTYDSAGNYVISISVITGSFSLSSGNRNYMEFLTDSGNSAVPASSASVYRNAVYAVELGSGITRLTAATFADCYSLLSVSMPNTINIMDNEVFAHCYSLRYLTLPNSISNVSDIGNSLFMGCYTLFAVSLPNTIRNLSSRMFSSCCLLQSITIPSNVGMMYSYIFDTCSSLTSIIIPNNVRLQEYAFKRCTALSNVILANGVRIGGTYVFDSCSCLQSLVLPSTVTFIPDVTFNGCSSLSSIVLEEGVTTIGISAFSNCYCLSSITLPSTVVSMSGNCFSGCYSLSYIKFESVIPPQAVSGTFSGVPTTAKILVPAGTLETYKSAANYPDPATYTYEEY